MSRRARVYFDTGAGFMVKRRCIEIMPKKMVCKKKIC